MKIEFDPGEIIRLDSLCDTASLRAQRRVGRKEFLMLLVAWMEQGRAEGPWPDQWFVHQINQRHSDG